MAIKKSVVVNAIFLADGKSYIKRVEAGIDRLLRFKFDGQHSSVVIYFTEITRQIGGLYQISEEMRYELQKRYQAAGWHVIGAIDDENGGCFIFS